MIRSALAFLANRRVLVVEDEYMIAAEVADMLDAAGAKVLGPVPDLTDALALIKDAAPIDAALLDVNLRGEAVWPLVDVLLTRSVPLMLATGYDAGAIPSAYTRLPRHQKPATGGELIRSLARVLRSAAPA